MLFFSMNEVDLEGMDRSWNSSQWVDVLRDQKADESEDQTSCEQETIPQLDGPADEKPSKFVIYMYTIVCFQQR